MTEAQQRTHHTSEQDSDPNTMPGSDPTVEDLRHDVELTREELADSVSELASKLDVKTRTTEAMQRQYITAAQHRGAIGASALGLLGLIVALIAVNRMRNR